jgi:hypothetical protein
MGPQSNSDDFKSEAKDSRGMFRYASIKDFKILDRKD